MKTGQKQLQNIAKSEPAKTNNSNAHLCSLILLFVKNIYIDTANKCCHLVVSSGILVDGYDSKGAVYKANKANRAGGLYVLTT